MTSFALELSDRLFKNSTFQEKLSLLQSTGAASTLPKNLEDFHVNLKTPELIKLLYCASIFAQADGDFYKGVAQTIALNSILTTDDEGVRERGLRVLVEIGNFPGISYIEKTYGSASNSLIGLLQRGLAEELNTVAIGKGRISLTDYQKTLWDYFPSKDSIAISAPTSAGKSFLIIEYLCRVAENSKQFAAVYIAPTRALLAEVNQTICSRMEGVDNLRISTVPTLDPIQCARQIFVLTQERLQALLSISSLCFDLVIVDEVQNISDGQRGMILQETIEQILQRSGKTQVVMLAPGADGFSEAAKSVGIQTLQSAITTLSPVLQNRILVSTQKNRISLSLLLPTKTESIGTISTDRGFDVPAARLAAVALELGSDGGSLVYAPGPSDSEIVAAQISNGRKRLSNSTLEELATFVEQHIHADYALAGMIRRGVAFHYGKMPNLLRDAIEVAFKGGWVNFLVCTTTLFQGVNLPARNVFIGTPTRGKNNKVVLDPALLWNFAGRAGRMKRDIVGNVFLVDYDSWEQQPMSSLVRFKINPAFNATVIESFDEILDGLQGNLPKIKLNDDHPEKIRAAVGLLISRATRGDVAKFTTRVLEDLSEENTQRLIDASIEASNNIKLPESILSTNWTIDPFGQRRLYDRLVKEIQENNFQLLIPINPNIPDAYQVYVIIFNLLGKEIYGHEGNYGSFVAVYALPWMKGVPYPVMIKKAIEFEKNRISKLKTESARSQPVNISKVVRSVFDTIENVVRFQFVQLGKAYIDLLKLALRNEDREDLVLSIFDFSLALELGVGTESGRSYIELGISRIAAAELDKRFPNSSLTVAAAREWIWKMEIKSSGLSPIIIRELRVLGLLPPEEINS